MFVEVGETFCSIAAVDSSAKSAKYIDVYSFDAMALNESIDAILKLISDRKKNVSNLVVSSAFPQALLVPNKFFHLKASLLHNIYNLNHFFPLNDPIAEWQLMNVYALPLSIHKKITEQHPYANFMHAYTPLLKIYNGFTSDHQLSAHFIGKQFRVMVKKNHHIQMVQTYSYSSPMDVVYFLLKICSEFQLPQEETQIIISGLIEENSALYKELHNYFLHLHFAISETLSLPEHEYPNHFFTSLHNLAACAL
jgi:hypothetical protein